MPSPGRIFSQHQGWREGEVLRRLHAVAERRGGFFVATTHPEAFGFCPSREGTDSLACCLGHQFPLWLWGTSYH